MDVTFHLVPLSYWNAAASDRDYYPADFARDGFIHCTDAPDEMARVANRYYGANPEPHVYLYIDKARVRAPVRYDDAAQWYPHIYGALNREAILAVRAAGRAPDGAFLAPEPLSL